MTTASSFFIVNCPACGGATRVVPNPFVGVGLAVHEDVRACTSCVWAAPRGSTRVRVEPRGVARGGAGAGVGTRDEVGAVVDGPGRRGAVGSFVAKVRLVPAAVAAGVAAAAGVVASAGAAGAAAAGAAATSAPSLPGPVGSGPATTRPAAG